MAGLPGHPCMVPDIPRYNHGGYAKKVFGEPRTVSGVRLLPPLGHYRGSLTCPTIGLVFPLPRDVVLHHPIAAKRSRRGSFC